MGFQVTKVQKALGGVSYPSTSDELADHAAGNGASDDLVGSLRGMQKGTFDGPDDVMAELKGQLGGSSDG